MKYNFIVIIFILLNSSTVFAKVKQNQFEKIRDVFITTYTQEFQSKGGTLDITSNHSSSSPQILSRKTVEGKWQIEIYQSMLDLELQTIPTLTMMLCHEIGHFLGEGPYVIGRPLSAAVRQRAPKKMSNEGQADFYSTSQCFRNLQKIIPELNLTPSLNLVLTEQCYNSYKIKDDIDSCLSGLQTARDLALVYQEAMNKIGIPTSFQETFSNEITERTLNFVDEYPTLECRYQTLVHGILCADVSNGECVDSKWSRPQCWFKD